MRALDCHTIESTLTSLGFLLSRDPGQLRAELISLSIAEFTELLHRAPHPNDRMLWHRIVGPETPPPIPDVTYWFHATRVPPGTDFAEALQPLGARLSAIEAFLEALARRLDPPIARPVPTDTSFWGQ
jgi:hypothetical protein